MKKVGLTIFWALFSLQTQSQVVLKPFDSIARRIDFNEKHEYKIRANNGDYLDVMVDQKGIDLVITVIGTSGKLGFNKEFDGPNPEGPERISFQAEFTGEYKFIVTPFKDSSNTKSGNYVIQYQRKTNRADFSKQENEFVQWIKTNSIKLKSLEAGSGFDDLKPLAELLRTKRVVALGEATHGTREFFQMKHRMLEFLITELGFTVFGIEASYTRCAYTNEYILYGKGDLDTAATIQGQEAWRTEELRGLIQWMRTYNANNPKTKIQFVGFDLAGWGASAYEISKVYDRIEPANKIVIDSLLRKVVDARVFLSGDTTIKTLVRPIENLIVNFLQRKGQYRQVITEEEYEHCLWNLKILHQYVSAFDHDPRIYSENLGDRDFYMAQNIFSWLNTLPADTKMMIWAHNGHIAKDYLNENGHPSMGSYLKKYLKDEYYAIGFDFYKGRFRANDSDIRDSPEWEVLEVGAAPMENLGSYFKKASQVNSFLNLQGASNDKTIDYRLINKPFFMHSIGTNFSRKWSARDYSSPTILRQAYDGVIFIEESNPSIPLKKISIDKFKF